MEKRYRVRVQRLGIEEVITAPRSPWQNPSVERVVGSIVSLRVVSHHTLQSK